MSRSLALAGRLMAVTALFAWAVLVPLFLWRGQIDWTLKVALTIPFELVLAVELWVLLDPLGYRQETQPFALTCRLMAVTAAVTLAVFPALAYLRAGGDPTPPVGALSFLVMILTFAVTVGAFFVMFLVAEAGLLLAPRAVGGSNKALQVLAAFALLATTWTYLVMTSSGIAVGTTSNRWYLAPVLFSGPNLGVHAWALVRVLWCLLTRWGEPDPPGLAQGASIGRQGG